MASGNTIRLVSGGTIQVRTGTLKESGPQGPKGDTGSTGPAPKIGSFTIASNVAWGTTPSTTMTGTGTTADPYNITLTIPSVKPVFASSATVTNNTGTASMSVAGTGDSGSPITFTLNIPPGPTGSAGSSGTGYTSFNSLVSGLLYTAIVTTTQASASATVTIGSTINTASAQTAVSTDLPFTSTNATALSALSPGMTVSGTNVPTGSTIVLVNPSAAAVAGLAAYSVRINQNTSAVVASGTTITFNAVPSSVAAGWKVSGTNVPANSTVSSVTTTTMSMSNATVAGSLISSGTVLTFTAPTTADASIQPSGTTDDTTTSEQGLPIPKVDTKPAIPYFFKVLVKALDKYVVARFDNSGARTTARASQSAGELTFLRDKQGLYINADGTTNQTVAQIQSGNADPSGVAPDGTIYIRY